MRAPCRFPTVEPEDFDWVGEAQPLPEVESNPTGPTVAVAKIAGIVGLSNEMVADNSISVTSLLGQAIASSMGPKLDNGLLYGAGSPAPVGILAGVPVALEQGVDLRTDTILAWGELVDAGADPANVVAFASGGDVAEELARVSTTTERADPRRRCRGDARSRYPAHRGAVARRGHRARSSTRPRAPSSSVRTSRWRCRPISISVATKLHSA